METPSKREKTTKRKHMVTPSEKTARPCGGEPSATEPPPARPLPPRRPTLTPEEKARKGRETSKAYDNTRAKALHDGKTPEQAKAEARDAYAIANEAFYKNLSQTVD